VQTQKCAKIQTKNNYLKPSILSIDSTLRKQILPKVKTKSIVSASIYLFSNKQTKIKCC
jgi:hypothetical protein